MKTILQIRFDASVIPGGADTILKASGCGPDVATVEDVPVIEQTVVGITLEDSDPRVAEVFRLLAENGKPDPLYGRHDVFTEDELQTARLLVMIRHSSHYAFGGQGFHETEYDMTNACATCGTGVRQTSALLIDASDVSKIKGFLAASTSYHDIFVKEKMLKRLQKAGVTGFSLRDVYSRRKNGETIALPRKQIVANHVLPPMHSSSLLDRKRVCPTCHRGGYLGVDTYPLRFVYRAKDLADILDVNVTWEWFGETKRMLPNSLGVRFSHPWMLVTPKVMNILRVKDGEDAFHWKPIRVIDE